MAETLLKESSVVEIASEMDQMVAKNSCAWSESSEENIALEKDHNLSALTPAHVNLSTIITDKLSINEVEDEVTIEMKEMIQGCRDGGFPPECCIYKVPIVLRELKPEAYTPKLVSIGPFNHGDPRLKDMESHKQILFKRFTQRAKSGLDDLVRCVKDLEPQVRASYADTISLEPKELVKLTLMDAAFIIEFFIMRKSREMHKDDVTVSQPWLANSIILDLILLENQLPFFIIEELFNKALPHNHLGGHSFLGLACSVFKHYGKKLETIPKVKIKHFTDLIRWFYLQGSEQHPPSKAQKHILRYNANELQEAGIKFKARERNSLLDLKFSGHTLEIPQIDVDDRIEILFHNMIALEQRHYPHASYITEYTAIMDWLIDMSKDVDILIHNNIVRNNLGDSNNVATLFNGLGKNVLYASSNDEYIDICKRLNSFCQSPRHKMIATLRRDYFNTPWRTVASIAGIILLLLTIAQTVFSVLQVY